MAGTFETKWKTKLKEFEKNAGKKKAQKAFFGYSSANKDVTKAFATADKAQAALKKVKPAQGFKAIGIFGKAIENMKKYGYAYIRELKKAAEQDPAKKDLAKLLAILAKDIDAIIAQAEASYVEAEEAMDNNGNMNIQKAIDVGPTRAKLFATLKRGAAWVAAIERKPEVATFNKTVNKATRDVTVHVKSLERMFKGTKHERYLFMTSNPLDGWAHKMKKLPDEATPQDVSKEVTAISTAFGQIMTWVKKEYDPA